MTLSLAAAETTLRSRAVPFRNEVELRHSYALRVRTGEALTSGPSCSIVSLRTDSVNRGFCISIFTLEIVVRALFFRVVFFFIIREY
jgi:hypothetical protein